MQQSCGPNYSGGTRGAANRPILTNKMVLNIKNMGIGGWGAG
jgi:hypothetical protein